MAIGWLSRCSASLVLVLLFATSLNISSVPERLFDDGNLFLALNLNSASFPGRNSGLPRRSTRIASSPSWKLQAPIYLANVSLSASYLLLLAGDVSSNPGPVKDPCAICSKGCRSNQRAIQCDGCDKWHHAKCLNMGVDEYYSLATNESSTWMCFTCLFPGIDCLDDSYCNTTTQQRSDNNDFHSDVRMLRGFKIAHLNVNRLVNKLDHVKELVHKHSFDILTLSETWLAPNILDNEITIPGYSLVRKDRQCLTKSCGGGVLIFVRDGIPFVVMSDLIKHNFECLWVEIKRPKCKRMILCCSYRPDDGNIDGFISNLADSLNYIDTENSEIVLVGDFNIDYSTKNQLRRKLDEFALQHSLSQIICKPTRVTENSSTTIDLMFVNNTHRVVQSDVLQSSISDHSIVFCTIKGGVKKLPPKLLEYRCFKSYNKEAFLRDLSNLPWSIIESANDVDDAVFLWEGLFNSIANDHAPIKSKRVKGTKTPWVTNKLLEIRSDRDYHWKQAQKCKNSQYHWQMYRKLRNCANSEEKKLKSKYYCRLIEDAKGDSSKMWKAIKETLPSNHNEINAVFGHGKLQTDPKGIAETLNNHFSSIGKSLAKAFRGLKPTQYDAVPTLSFSLKYVTSAFVEKQLRLMKTNKAVGLDSISARLLRDAANVLASPLRDIINLSFEKGQFPSSWKCAKVTALFKEGDKSDKDNYRPISVLPTVSKVIERAVHSQLYDYLDSNNLLAVNQFGFRRARSTALALTQFTDEVLSNMDKGLVNGVVFIDLKKAFDTVDHVILLGKLKSLGLRSKNLEWFHSYLSSRYQKTVIGQASSPARKVSVGVPQGSILGPLLFAIYINELPKVLRNTTVTLFADDTAIYCSSQSARDLQTMLNQDLDRLAQWLYEHKLTLNISKSKFMLIGGPRKLNTLEEFTLIIKEKELDRVNSFKYLGVIINENLSWTDHVDYIKTKVSQRLGVLQRIKHLLPRNTRELFVKAMVLPILDYADVTWGDKSNTTLMNKIQLLQNKAAKLILDMPKHSSATEALDLLGWDTLEKRRRSHRLFLVFKSLNGLIDWNFNFNHFKDIHDYNTRFNNNICKPQSKRTWGQHRFVCHAVDDWNALPDGIRNISDFSVFRRLVKNM